MKLLDLFSGIGGFSLGLERAGFQTVAFCEIDPWCRRVLAKHWPGVPCYDDVRQLDAARLRADGIDRIDALCGGFPCQDISLAGKGAGLDGERSGLWREFRRLIGDLRPRFAFVENVGALRGRGLDAVLADLTALGYDAEWHAIPAAAVGAPHLRDRIWIVGHAADADGGRCQQQRQPQHRDEQGAPGCESDGLGARGWWPGPAAADAPGRGSPQLRGLFGPLARALAAASAPWERTSEPPLRRVDARLSPWMDGAVDASQADPVDRQILLSLQGADRARLVQWKAGGCHPLQPAQVLLKAMRRGKGRVQAGDVALASSAAPQDELRGVWHDASLACASCRRHAEQQQPGEHPDPLHLLSSLLACDCSATRLGPAWSTSAAADKPRLKGLGNAVVPEIPEILGRAVLERYGRAA